MVTALVSLLTDRPVRAEVGMTGEISLQGQVLPIGGLKQKILAAHRAGLTTVIFPKRNEPDLDDVPEDVRRDITFHVAETIDEVLEHALSRPSSFERVISETMEPVPQVEATFSSDK
jgi:ATP-dependent Lon protease